MLKAKKLSPKELQKAKKELEEILKETTGGRVYFSDGSVIVIFVFYGTSMEYYFDLLSSIRPENLVGLKQVPLSFLLKVRACDSHPVVNKQLLGIFPKEKGFRFYARETDGKMAVVWKNIFAARFWECDLRKRSD